MSFGALEDESETRLSEFQLAEIKKAFSICDQDGNGSVDANELRVVIRALLDEDPTDEEMQKIMITMDKDQNGRVELKEFIDAMADWFAEDERSRGGSKRRKLNADQERSDVHSQIRSFFQQFKSGDNFDVVRKKLSRGGSRSGDSGMMDVDRLDSMSVFGNDAKLSSANKLDFLKFYRGAMGNMPRCIAVINGDNRFEQLDAVSHLAKMLSIVEVFSTPSERRAVADDIVELFQQLITANIIKRLVMIIRDNTQHSLQYHALRCIFYFAPGPRIASTPRESLLHPDQFFFKRLVIGEGALPVLFQLFMHPVAEVRDQALSVVGCLASHNPEVRDLLLQNGGMNALLPLITPQQTVEFIRKVAWVLSLYFGVTHPVEKLPPLTSIQPAFPYLAALAQFEDEGVLVHTLNAFCLALPGGDPDPTLRARVLSFLAGNRSNRVISATLEVLRNVAEYDQKLTDLLIQQGLLDACKKLITANDIGVRLGCCELLFLLAKKVLFIEAMVKVGLVEMILKLISLDEQLRWKLVKVIKYVSRGTPAQVLNLVQNNAIQILCKSLSFFKAYDRVLTDIYKYCGPTYNFEFVHDILTALEKILDSGELATEDTSAPNKFALEFDLECIDKIKSFMQAIKESRPEDLAAWRQRKPGEGASVEAKVKTILYKVKVAHDSPMTTKPARAHITRMILEIWTQFFAQDTDQQQQQLQDQYMGQSGAVPVQQQQQVVITNPQAALADKWTVKCNYEDDIRVLEVPKNVASWEEVRNAIFNKYGLEIPTTHAHHHHHHHTSILITYLDEDGDHITVDSLALLEKASQLNNGRAIKLQLVAKTHSNSSFGSPVGSPSGIMSPLAHRLAAEASDDAAAASRKRTRDGEVKRTTGSLESEKHVINTQIIVPSVFAQSATTPAGAAPHEQHLMGDLGGIRRSAQRQVFEDLEMRTHFGKDELERLYNDWVKNSSADGQVNRQQFEAGMVALGIKDPLVIEQNFSAFDQNRDGLIDFREFVCGLSTVLRGDTEERLRFMFRSYDLANHGYLTREEIYRIFMASLVTSNGRASEEEVRRQVEATFAEIDVNGDGKISFDEFKHAVETQKLLINCSIHFGSQQQQQ